jgi:hypothetical protein
VVNDSSFTDQLAKIYHEELSFINKIKCSLSQVVIDPKEFLPSLKKGENREAVVTQDVVSSKEVSGTTNVFEK